MFLKYHAEVNKLIARTIQGQKAGRKTGMQESETCTTQYGSGSAISP